MYDGLGLYRLSVRLTIWHFNWR